MPDTGREAAPNAPGVRATGAAQQDRDAIVIRGARQNNLKNLSLELPANELIVVTGVSGSGKSSLVFDTLYAEGQRRYVETFSPYARQFLDRMDKPQVDAIEGIPPAIAIDQVNPVRTSRSTVGTMTELNDHLKLLFARAARLYCRGCGQPVARDTPDTIYADLATRATAAGDPRLIITFPVTVPKNFSEAEVKELLERQGYTRVHGKDGRYSGDRPGSTSVFGCRARAGHRGPRSGIEDRPGPGQRLPPRRRRRYRRHPSSPHRLIPRPWRFSTDLHCPDCDIHYAEPTPSLFSFNSPVGACETCRGFGRMIGVDYGLVVPDESENAARKRDQAVADASPTAGWNDDLVEYAKKRGVPVDTPWRELTEAQRQWVLEGDRRLGELAEVLARKVVRRRPLLQVAGDQGLQDARARAALALPRLHAVHRLRRRAAEDRRRSPGGWERQRGRGRGARRPVSDFCRTA